MEDHLWTTTVDAAGAVEALQEVATDLAAHVVADGLREHSASCTARPAYAAPVTDERRCTCAEGDPA